MHNESVNVVRTAPGLRRTSLGNAARLEGTLNDNESSSMSSDVMQTQPSGQVRRKAWRNGVNGVPQRSGDTGEAQRIGNPAETSLQHEHGVSH